MSVEDWRRKIDEIDRRLVELLNERSQCVIEIGKLKQVDGMALYQPDREREVLDGRRARQSRARSAKRPSGGSSNAFWTKRARSSAP